MDWLSTLLYAGAAGFLFLLIGGIRRVWFSPLSKFPGPKFAALTLWNEFYWDVVKRGTFMWKIEEMHKKYGPIVRINPFEIHILDPDYYNELYAGNRELDKYQWWVNLAGAEGSGFSTITHSHHRLRRGALNPFFSVRSVTQLEPMLVAKVEKLSARFRQLAGAQEVVRIDAAFMALTMDIICDYAFADDQRHLDEPDFKLVWKETIIGAFEGGALGRQFPWLLPLTKRLPIGLVHAMNPAVGYLLTWQEAVKAKVRPIMTANNNDNNKSPAAPPRTIFHTLLASDLPAEEKTLQRLCDEGELLTGAGSETTAQTLTRILFYLKHVPAAHVRLQAEIDRAMPDASVLPAWSELQQNPYLNAVIKEGLRLSYGTTTRLPRIAHEDIRYKDYVIPAGTPVSETPYFVLTHPGVFPNPTAFRPERWLAPENEGKQLDKYLVSFGKGSRQCLGMNLAYAELYLALSMVVRRFDWDMYETGLDDVVCKHDFFVAVADLESKGVRAVLRVREQ
ncbi:cytochrome P450 [Podospora appendiculata]|uniref:Cytochrome P450 n=1 Tax=Podospora appendiculata TaxID=314037 RepID=A0AAE0XGN4_9PEZI|nr:cytochrome P450 [Podospora appendiculata]